MTAERQPQGTAFALRDPLPWAAFSGLARLGEELGYAAVFLPEIAGRDALVALAGLADETREVTLGTGVIPMTSRRPLLTAMAAATVHERSGGRLVLGLGTGTPAPGALDRLRRLVATLRRLFAGEEVGADGVRMRLWLDQGTPPPIWISALGPRAVRLAGEVADGVLLNWCPPERVAMARTELRDGALAAGRDPAEVTVGVYVRASFGTEPAVAMRALRLAVGEYSSYPGYARQFAAAGLGAEATAAAVAHAAGRPDDVPEALVRKVCLTGDPAAARTGLSRFRDAGADLPVVYPVSAGDDPASAIRATLEALSPG